MKVLEFFKERFGIEESAFDGFGLYMGSRGRVYLGPKTLIGKPDVISPGLLAARVSNAIKPSTNFIQLFGHLATRNVIDVGKEDAAAFARGEDLAYEGDEGYVIVSYEGRPMGCGHLKGSTVRNLLPKSRRQELKYL